MGRLLVALLLLASACATAPSAPGDNPSWAPLYGVYAFNGTIEGQARLTLEGTLLLEEGRYDVHSSAGSCEGRLPQGPSSVLRVGCPSFSLQLRRRGDVFDAEGRATVTVTEQVQTSVCRPVAGRAAPVCTTQMVPRETARSGRIVVTPGGTPR